MGFLNSLTDTLLNGNANDAVSKIKNLGGGMLGKLNETKQLAEDLASRPRPGTLCFQSCPVDDERCEDCLAKQQEILNGLEDLQNLENAINNAKNNPTPVTPVKRKCSLCGAPIEKGVRSCPYCDTPYTAEAIIGDIPGTEVERDRLLLEKATEVFSKYSVLFKENYAYKMESDKMPQAVKTVIKFKKSASEQMMTMNSVQVKAGAGHYGVSYAAYISGVISGTYKTFPMLIMEKQKEEMRKRLQEQRERDERQRQIDAEARERQRQLNAEARERKRAREREFWERRRQSYRAPGYIGGAGQLGYCCGNCTYYMPHDNKCVYNEFRHPSGARDYCNDHRSR